MGQSGKKHLFSSMSESAKHLAEQFTLIPLRNPRNANLNELDYSVRSVRQSARMLAVEATQKMSNYSNI